MSESLETGVGRSLIPSDTTPLLADSHDHQSGDERMTCGSASTPLFNGVTAGGDPPETPLPKLQLFIVYYMQLAEPISAMVISPFVNEVRWKF
jgi:hypothetical protein